MCNVHKSLTNIQIQKRLYYKFLQREFMGGSPGELNVELVTWENIKKGWRMNCDVGEATEGLDNEL